MKERLPFAQTSLGALVIGVLVSVIGGSITSLLMRFDPFRPSVDARPEAVVSPARPQTVPATQKATTPTPTPRTVTWQEMAEFTRSNQMDLPIAEPPPTIFLRCRGIAVTAPSVAFFVAVIDAGPDCQYGEDWVARPGDTALFDVGSKQEALCQSGLGEVGPQIWVPKGIRTVWSEISVGSRRMLPGRDRAIRCHSKSRRRFGVGILLDPKGQEQYDKWKSTPDVNASESVP